MKLVKYMFLNLQIELICTINNMIDHITYRALMLQQLLKIIYH